MHFPKKLAQLVVAAALLLSQFFMSPLPAHAAINNSVTAHGVPSLDDGSQIGSVGIDIQATKSGNGYYVVGSDGGIFTYGDAAYRGSMGGTSLQQPIVGLALTASGNGYWEVASDGGVFTFGDANYFGSLGNVHLQSPIIGITPTLSGNGYWMYASDGGVFTYGDASYRGSAVPYSPGEVVGMSRTPSGNGYWLVTIDGAIYTFGDAPYMGGGNGVVSASVTDLGSVGNGYVMLTSDGNIYTFGDATFHGVRGANNFPAQAFTLVSSGAYWILSSSAGNAPPNSGNGRRIVYSNSGQRVWLVNDNNTVYKTYAVSGKRGVPAAGFYHVFSKTTMSITRSGTLRLPYMTRFAHGASLSIGFHGIPLRRDGSPIQSDSELGQYRSHGCVRQNQSDAVTLYNWTPVGTLVAVLP